MMENSSYRRHHRRSERERRTSSTKSRRQPAARVSDCVCVCEGGESGEGGGCRLTLNVSCAHRVCTTRLTRNTLRRLKTLKPSRKLGARNAAAYATYTKNASRRRGARITAQHKPPIVGGSARVWRRQCSRLTPLEPSTSIGAADAALRPRLDRRRVDQGERGRWLAALKRATNTARCL